jgi:hypothetical protein
MNPQADSGRKAVEVAILRKIALHIAFVESQQKDNCGA